MSADPGNTASGEGRSERARVKSSPTAASSRVGIHGQNKAQAASIELRSMMNRGSPAPGRNSHRSDGSVGRGQTLQTYKDSFLSNQSSASATAARGEHDYGDACATMGTAKKEQTTSNELDASSIEVPTHAPEKEASGVCSSGHDNVRSSVRTSENSGAQVGIPKTDETNHDSIKTSDVPVSVHESPEKMSLRFLASRTESKRCGLFPQRIDVAKWTLLENNGMLDERAQLSGNNVSIGKPSADGRVTVTNSRAMQDGEANTWIKECMDIMWEMLLCIQTVSFCDTDIREFVQCVESVQNKDLQYTTDTDGRWLTVFMINSGAMDEFLKTAIPALRRNGDRKMLITIQFHPNLFMKLDRLGFNKSYQQNNPGVEMKVNYDSCEYILDCHSDLLHAFHSERNAFLDKLESVHFEAPDLYKRLLLDANRVFQRTFTQNVMPCWFTENQGLLQVVSPSKDVLSRVEQIVCQRMVGYTVWLQTPLDYQHCLSIFDHHRHESEMFDFQLRADGKGIGIAGLKEFVVGLIKELQPMDSSPMQMCVRIDMGNKGPGQQDRCGNKSRSGEVEQSPGTDCTKLEQHGSKDRSTTRGDRSSSEDNPPGEPEQCGGKDQSSVRRSDRTDGPSVGQGCSTGAKDPKHQERSDVTDKSQAEQDRSDSLNTKPSHPFAQPGHSGAQSGHPGAQPGHPGAQPGHSGAQSGHSGTHQPGHSGTHQPGPGAQDKAPVRNAQQPETASAVQQPETASAVQLPDQTIPGSGRRPEHGAQQSIRYVIPKTASAVQQPDQTIPGSERRLEHGAQQGVRYPIPEEIAQLLKVDAVCDRFKSKLMDKECIVNMQSLSKGFVTITYGREEDVSSTLDNIFHREQIEFGEDDPNMEEALKSFCKRHAGKVGCVFGRGWFKVCTTAYFKDEICIELETLKRSECLVPLPLYAHDFLALKIEKLNTAIRQHVDKSVTASIHEENQGILLSAERKFIKKAVQWLHDFVLNLEVTETTVTVDEALFLQDLRGQEMILGMEDTYDCRIDTVAESGNCGLRATGPSGQQLMVCGDTMAATDCDCIVLPLCDGQTEWSSLQRWILRRSLLSEDRASYQSLCHGHPVSLQGNADFAGKTIIIVSVPAEVDTGANKDKDRITEAYKEVFAMCGDRCVAVCAKQTPNIPLHKSLKPLLVAVWGTANSPSSCCCQTVVIYTDSAQDSKVACQIVTVGCPQEWHLKPERVSRPKSGKGTIKVCIGEIQNLQADVIVNSTNTRLTPEQGAVEKVIARAAGQEMITACRRLYPDGIPVNGMAVTDSFRMNNAKKIYHIALSPEPFQEDKREVLLHDLRQVIHRCLMMASMEQHRSIAFPTLGSGRLGYPCDAVARVMFSTISNFFTEMPHTTLQTVSIVVYQKNDEAIQALKMEEISQLYIFSSEQEETVQKHEMRLRFKTHSVQIVQGDVFNKPWVADVCVHGQLPSDRRESASSAGGCRSVVVKPGKVSKHDYKDYLRKAFKLDRTIQIAGDTLSSDSLKDLASALETALLKDRLTAALVSVVFNDEMKIHEFVNFFSEMQIGHGETNTKKENQDQIFVCSYKKGEEVLRKIEKFKVPDRYEKLMSSYRKTIADEHKPDSGRDDKADDQTEAQAPQESDQIQVSIPNNLLKKMDLSKIMGLKYVNVGKRITTAFVKLEDFVNTAIDPREQQAEEQTTTPGAEADSSAGWSSNVDQLEDIDDVWCRNLDDLEMEALRFFLGAEFDQIFDVKEIAGDFLVTFRGAPSKSLEKQVDSLRYEDVQLNPEEVAMLGDSFGVVSAFVKPVPSSDKATVFAFDDNAMISAKYLVAIKVGRVKVISRGQQRFDTGTPGQVDQTPAQSVEVPGHGRGSIMQTADFTTPSGVKVSVYKTDITNLPVDAIVNAANEKLDHGGGVALAISKAAGFALEDEGRQHLAKHGPLRVTEVVETTAGALPCKKVLHAVGPCWGDYTDKTLCGQHLVDTVFNCLQKADSLGFTSIALPSISAAIFGVPQDVCADSYLSAVKKFDERRGRSTSVRHVHFVDVSDAMISTIQGTFTAQWSAPASNTAGGQADKHHGTPSNVSEALEHECQGMNSRNQSYPDPHYLVRVLAELADKGITEKDLTDTQRDFIDNPARVHALYPDGHFSQHVSSREWCHEL